LSLRTKKSVGSGDLTGTLPDLVRMAGILRLPHAKGERGEWQKNDHHNSHHTLANCFANPNWDHRKCETSAMGVRRGKAALSRMPATSSVRR
jgi:hypothetical protein